MSKYRVGRLFEILGLFPILLLLIVIFSLATDTFFSGINFKNVLREVSINLVLATGMTLIILTGGIDLSVGSVLAVSAVFCLKVSLIPDLQLLAVPSTLLLGAIIGMIQGSLIIFFRLPPFIVTLGGLSLWRGAAYLLADGTTLINNDLAFAVLGNADFLGIPWLVWLALLVVLACWALLRFTVLGTHIYAVGGNPLAARLSGVNVVKVLLFVYTLMGVLAALAGLMLASRLYSANGLLGQSFELDAIAASILGGTSFVGGVGGVPGTVVGALIMGVINNGLTLLQVSFYAQLVAKGGVIVLAVIIDKFRRSGRE